MTLEACLAFAALNFVYSLAPGPNAALIVGTIARRGSRAGLAVLVGIALAEVLWAITAIAVVVGLLDLAQVHPERIAKLGAFALVLLGATMLLSRRTIPSPLQGTCELARRQTPVIRSACKGVAVGITNPLSLVFFASIAPTFLPKSHISFEDGALFVIAAMVSCTAAHIPYLGAAKIKHSRAADWLERACGLALCMLGGAAILDQSMVLA